MYSTTAVGLRWIAVGQNYALTAVFGFIGLVGTINTDVTNAMVGYARQVIGAHEMRVFGTAIFGYARIVFCKKKKKT